VERGEGLSVHLGGCGPGVPPEEQGRTWRRLYRGDHSRSQRGLGLGLSVVKARVEAHGDRVAVANHFSGGAVFTVGLPATAGMS